MRFPNSSMDRAVFAVAALVVTLGCNANHDDIARPLPNDPVVTGITPPKPAFSGLQVRDGGVTLNWTVDDASDVGSYRVYRSSPISAEQRIATGVTAMTYDDGALVNGTPYTYRVAAVLTNGLEGDKSDPATATPSLYAVAIANGNDFVNNRNVTVSLTAPGGTSAFRIGETMDLTAEPWRSMVGSAPFTLAAGDGLRTVYVQFRDASGNVSEVVSDTVTLDTVAEIQSVTHDAAAVVAPGTTIHFEVVSGEADGVATVDIGTARTGLRLYDDGGHGDGAAGDGRYALDYEIPLGLETSDAAIIGAFTDAAGNVAERRSAATPITINSPPSAVSLEDPFAVQATELELSWSQNLDDDFAAYRVFRAQSSAVLTDPDRVLVVELSNSAATAHTDEGLMENTTYFYVVVTVDTFGFRTSSNTVSATTANDPPPPLAVTSSASTSVSVTLEWDPTDILDFVRYRVLRSVESSPGTFTEVAQIDQAPVGSYTDFFPAVGSTTSYFYKVRLEDAGGLTTDSNVVTVEVSP